MDTSYSLGIAIVVAAAAVIATGYDRVTFDAPTSERAAAQSAAPASAPAPMVLSAAAVRIDPPPNALLCQEQSAELRVASGAPVKDFLEEFFLVSDPRETCRTEGMAQQAGYDPDGGRCYTLRTPGTGEPDLPLVCAEEFSQGPDGIRVGQMRCSGWNREIATGLDGDFSLTLASKNATAPAARISSGSCRSL
ncbi:hypothetical protein H0I76_12040 [Limibaculum sp. M0105]|uniref:Uncharacterized protein n=1 Tax=Thermohalobaculum xanthum TaxID=2753746 RepID=A0A8J7M8K5_9RHOB|nr:hypothetical protein [Thermohalobaculum xanthum]MBK0399922.1 hypothetical protein [Thermohalobaculum xanthum]